MKTALTLALSLCCLSCSLKPQAAILDPSLALLIPADTIAMVSVRLDQLQKTPIYQRYLSQINISQIEDFAQQTGVDPRRNLWDVLFITNGKNSAILGRGMFSDESEPRLDNLTKQGAKRFGYKGLNLIGDDTYAVLLVSPTVLAAGDTPFLKQMVDTRDKSTGPPPALAALIKNIPRESQLWGAYAGGPISLPFAPGSNLGNANKVLGLIQQGSYYFDLRTGINGVALGQTATEPDAQQLQGALKGLIGLGRLSTPSKEPDAQRIWDGFRVTEENKQVKLYVDQPPELVEKMIGLAANVPPLVLRRVPGIFGFWNRVAQVNRPSAFAHVIAIPGRNLHRDVAFHNSLAGEPGTRR